MFGMLMAYDRKKLLSFYIEVVHENFTVERNYFLGPAWFGAV